MSNDASKWTDKQISDMIALFNAGDHNQELEVRLSVSRNAFESIYTALMKAYAAGDVREPQLNRTINFISRNAIADQSSSIRVINYETSPAQSTYYTKTNLVKNIMVRSAFLPYIVSLSSEIPTGSEPVSHSAEVRVKARLSFETVSKPWRYDITATRSGKFNEMSAIIKDIRENFLPRGMTADNFLQTIDHGNTGAYEVEIEYIGENKDLQQADLMHEVDELFTMIVPKFADDMLYQEQIYVIASWILGKEAAEVYRKPTHRLKRLLNDTIAMSKNTYMEIWPPIGWYLTDKADGRRSVAIVSMKHMYILLSDKMLTYECPQLPTTICDCELVGDPDGKYDLYVFDMMVLADVNHSADGFETRESLLQKCADIVSELLPVGCGASVKHYERLGDDPAEYEAKFRAVYNGTYPYELDGLILVKPGAGYNDTLNYKWKPLMQNTIDFVAIKCPQSLLGMTPYITRPGKTLYLLCVGLSNRARDLLGIPVLTALKSAIECTNTRGYCPVQFSPSANAMAYLWWVDTPSGSDPYDRKIVELVQNPDARDLTEQWQLVRVRTDRFMEDNYYGNDYRTAESIYMNYVDPFHIESLWTPPSSYFTRESTDIYRDANRFKRAVITDIFKRYLTKGSKIIDLAGGRGADLTRYESLGIAHALFIDIDASAIAELIRRKFTLLTKRGAGETDTRSLRGPYDFNRRFTKSTRTTIHTLVADLSAPAEDLIVSTYQYGYNEKTVDAFVCNFAIHYLCKDEATIANLFKFIAAMSLPGAVFIFTTMDGERVFDLLKPVDTSSVWSSAEPLHDGDTTQVGNMKYGIRKQYAGTKLLPFGQNIEVYLSFADKFVAEPLCNISAVIKVAGKHGFALELSESMAGWFDTRNEMSAVDKEYVGLHQVVVLKYRGKK